MWLSWEAPSYGLTNYVEGTNQAFNVYATTNLGLPITNWPFYCAITNWSLGPTDAFGTWHTGPVMVLSPAQYFFAMTATNGNLETGLSGSDNNGPIPRTPANTTLKR